MALGRGAASCAGLGFSSSKGSSASPQGFGGVCEGAELVFKIGCVIGEGVDTLEWVGVGVVTGVTTGLDFSTGFSPTSSTAMLNIMGVIYCATVGTVIKHLNN